MSGLVIHLFDGMKIFFFQLTVVFLFLSVSANLTCPTTLHISLWWVEFNWASKDRPNRPNTMFMSICFQPTKCTLSVVVLKGTLSFKLERFSRLYYQSIQHNL